MDEKNNRKHSSLCSRIFSCGYDDDLCHFSKCGIICAGSFIIFVLSLCAIVVYVNCKKVLE
jgi:hypothetical protein